MNSVYNLHINVKEYENLIGSCEDCMRGRAITVHIIIFIIIFPTTITNNFLTLNLSKLPLFCFDLVSSVREEKFSSILLGSMVEDQLMNY